jgi:hypothetical protein
MPQRVIIKIWWLTWFITGALTPKSCNSLLQEYKAKYSEIDLPSLCEHLGRRRRLNTPNGLSCLCCSQFSSVGDLFTFRESILA